jgi:hypothetical protein
VGTQSICVNPGTVLTEKGSGWRFRGNSKLIDFGQLKSDDDPYVRARISMLVFSPMACSCDHVLELSQDKQCP